MSESRTAGPAGYNGWSNYETWAVALWIDNEHGSHLQRHAMAEEAWKDAEADGVMTREEDAADTLAERLKGWIVDEGYPDLGASLYSDLLTAALSEVNWVEIAENFLEDVDKGGAGESDDEQEELP